MKSIPQPCTIVFLDRSLRSYKSSYENLYGFRSHISSTSRTEFIILNNYRFLEYSLISKLRDLCLIHSRPTVYNNHEGRLEQYSHPFSTWPRYEEVADRIVLHDWRHNTRSNELLLNYKYVIHSCSLFVRLFSGNSFIRWILNWRDDDVFWMDIWNAD